MTRIHDMGGRFGYGAIKLEKADLNKSEIQNYVFEKDWHAKVWAFAHLTGPLGIWIASLFGKRDCHHVATVKIFDTASVDGSLLRSQGDVGRRRIVAGAMPPGCQWERNTLRNKLQHQGRLSADERAVIRVVAVSDSVFAGRVCAWFAAMDARGALPVSDPLPWQAIFSWVGRCGLRWTASPTAAARSQGTAHGMQGS